MKKSLLIAILIAACLGPVSAQASYFEIGGPKEHGVGFVLFRSLVKFFAGVPHSDEGDDLLPVNANVTDLDTPQGTNGWFGGKFTTSYDSDVADSDPTTFSTAGFDWDGSNCWLGSESFTTPQVCRDFGHPAASGNSAVWEYVVPAGHGGTAVAEFTAHSLAGGAKSIAIWVNNIKVAGYIHVSDITSITYSGTFAPGDVVYFELNSLGDYGSDATGVVRMTIAPGDITSNLVAWYKFDDGSGTTPVDSSGNGKDLVTMNSPTWVAGHVGGALSLSAGSTQQAYRTATGGIQASPFTVCGWNNHTPVGSVGWSILSSNSNAWDGWYGKSGSEGYMASVRDANAFGTAASYVGTDGVWEHTCWIVDSDFVQKIYLNGMLVATQVETEVPTNSAYNFTVGGQYIGNEVDHGNYDTVIVDDYRLYSRELTAADVGALYASY